MKTVLVKYFYDLVVVAVIKVQNSKKNIEARTCSISILDNIAVSQIPNYLQNLNYMLVQC